MAFLLCLAVALLVWLWTCGFVLGSLSGRAIWFTWSAFYLTVLDSAWVRFALSGNIILCNAGLIRLFVAATVPLNIATLLFLLSGVWSITRNASASATVARCLRPGLGHHNPHDTYNLDERLV